jgi:hypothetical protein
MSTGGYGIFANTTFRNRWDMGSRSVVSYTFLIDDPRLDFFIIYGPSLKQVLARYGEITGWPAFPPRKSFGPWFIMSGRGDTPDTTPLGIAKKFRELELPMDYFTPLVAAEDSNQQEQLARAPPGGGLLSATRRIAGSSSASPTRSVGGEQEAQRDEFAAPDSFHWSDPGSSADRPNADAASLPHQAATLGLQRPGFEDFHQRRTPRSARTAQTIQEAIIVAIRGLNRSHNHDLKAPSIPGFIAGGGPSVLETLWFEGEYP